MAVPQALLWPREPHTEAKHLILRGYLDAWWPILLSANTIVTYAEGYAGPGVYEEGEDGSPVLALQALLERDKPLPLVGRRAQVVLIEARADRLDRCRTQIADRLGELPAEVEVHARPGTCEDQLLPALREAGAFGHPLLVNLDPFSAGVPYEVLREVGQNRSSEVLISFMASWFVRFANHTDMDHGDRQFGDTTWRQVTGVPSSEKRRWLVDRYRERITSAGFKHTVWFELVDEGGRAFWLIFATNSSIGLAKMKESFWRVDPVRGVHFRDPRDPGQLTFDVGDDPHLASLRNLLSEHLAGRSDVLVDDIRDWTLEQTVFLPTHSMEVLRQWRAEDRLAVDLTGKLKRAARVTLRDASESGEPASQPELF